MFIITSQNETINQYIDILTFLKSMRSPYRKKGKYQLYNHILENPLYDNNNKQLFKEFILKNEKIKSMCYKFYFTPFNI